MLETKFWIQGEKTRLLRWMEWMMMAGFGMGAMCLVMPQWRFVFPFPVILVSCVLIYSFRAIASGAALYQTKGRLEISEQNIKVSGEEEHEFQSAALQRVEIKFSSYRGKAMGKSVGNGGNNKISFYLITGQPPIVVTFLADSHAQSQLFVKILRSWRALGVKIVADGIDLV